MIRNTFSLIFICLLLILHPQEIRGQEDKEEYVCFSLAAARELFKNGKSIPDKVNKLGFITRPVAIVVDPDSKDCIIVGKRDSEYPTIYLDDFVVALRAVYYYPRSTLPGVSIDPDHSSDNTDKNLVMYFGGIENTRFGRVCYEADYTLKKMAMGLIPTGSPNVISPWDMWCSNMGRNIDLPRSVNFFQPATASVNCSKNGASIVSFRLRVKSSNRTINEFNSKFTQSVNEHFNEISVEYPVFRELENLMCLYMLCCSIDSLVTTPRLGFYLKDYKTKDIQTERSVEVLYRGFKGMAYSARVKGDITFNRGDIIRMSMGDPHGFEKVVLEMRPDSETLIWIIEIIGSRKIKESPLEQTNSTSLCNFYLQKRNFRKALRCFNKMKIDFPKALNVTCGMALAYIGLSEPDSAMLAANEAMTIDSNSAYVKRVFGKVLLENKEYKKAIRNLRMAQQLKPHSEIIGCLLGESYFMNDDYLSSQTCFNNVLSFNKRSLRALAGKARNFYALGKYRESYKCWVSVLEAKPEGDMIGIASNEISKLIEEKRISISSIAKDFFPEKFKRSSKSIWGFGLNFLFDYGYGRDDFLPQNISNVDKQQINFRFPFRMIWIIRNKYRLLIETPLIMRFVPFEKASCFSLGNDNVICSGSEITMGGIGGFSGTSLFLTSMISDGTYGGPTLIVHSGVTTPVGDPLFERYWNAEGGEDRWMGALKFRNDYWRGKIAVQMELPASIVSKIIINGSFEQNITLEEPDTNFGWSLIGRRMISKKNNPIYLGIMTTGFNSEYENNIRFGFTLDVYARDEWQNFSIGLGLKDSSGTSDTFLFVSIGTGFEIFKFGLPPIY